MTVSPTSGLVTTEAGGTATFKVRLNSPPTTTVTIGLSSSNAAEGTVSPASLVFTPADWNLDQTVTVTGGDDAVDDGRVAYTIVTAATVSTDPAYNGLNPPDVSVTNRDDDAPAYPGLAFSFTIDDPGNLLGSNRADVLEGLEAAALIFSRLLDGEGVMDVIVRPDNSIPRFTGGVLSVSYVRTEGGVNIFENSTITEARSGIDPNGSTPDILISMNTSTYLPTVWFDPSGADRTGVLPGDRLDFISVALHEIGHGLGFQGYRDIDGPNYGGFPGDYMTSYDFLTSFGSGQNANILFFNGPEAVSEYGGPVPLTSVGPGAFLTSQNFFHLGNPAGMIGDDLILRPDERRCILSTDNAIHPVNSTWRSWRISAGVS